MGNNTTMSNEQKMLPLLAQWEKLLTTQKTTDKEMAIIRSQIIDLMTSDSMIVGDYQLSKHKNFGGYFTSRKKMDNREFMWVLQIRKRPRVIDHDNIRA